MNTGKGKNSTSVNCEVDSFEKAHARLLSRKEEAGRDRDSTSSALSGPRVAPALHQDPSLGEGGDRRRWARVGFAMQGGKRFLKGWNSEFFEKCYSNHLIKLKIFYSIEI